MKILLSVALLVLLNSCVNTKRTGAAWIPRNQVIYELKTNPDGDGTDYIYTHTLKDGSPAVITVPATTTINGDVAIRMVAKPEFKQDNPPIRRPWKAGDPRSGSFYFPLQDITVEGSPNTRFTGQRFRYIEFKPSIQAFSIPIKYRFGMRDTIKSAASTSFNIGFAYAFKFTSNTYKKVYWNNTGQASFLNHRVQKLTYGFGPFFGPTLIDLKSGNTDGHVTKDRSVVGATYGAFGVIGYNELQIGLALGFDNVFKTGGGTWIYSKKPWLGVIVALDLIK